MIYMKQLPNGNRIEVSAEQHAVDFHHPCYLEVIASSGLKVYKINKGEMPTRAEREEHRLSRYGRPPAMQKLDDAYTRPSL
jgi:hypothetical protein